MNVSGVNPQCFLSELLPYDPSIKKNGSLRTGLNEYRLLLVATEQAIKALQLGDLSQFDALIGENACQIRAVKIAMTAPDYLSSIDSVQKQLVNAKREIALLSKSLEGLMKKGTSLQTLLKDKGLDVALTRDESFLIQSFLLTVAKTSKPSKVSSPLCRNDVAEPKKLQQFGEGVSASFANSLGRKTRQLLSAASVAFVQQQASSLKDSGLETMCSQRFIDDHNSWACLPMFWTYKTLLLAAQNKEIPIIIYGKFLAKDKEYGIVKEESILFKPTLDCEGLFQYEASPPCPSDLAKAAIVIQGVVCADQDNLPRKSVWRTTITTQKLLDVILAGAADHRQYPRPGADRQIDELNDAELRRYQELARTKGYALENPSLFFIQHVYPGTIESMPQFARKARLAERMISTFLPKQPVAEWPQRAMTYITDYLGDSWIR